VQARSVTNDGPGPDAPGQARERIGTLTGMDAPETVTEAVELLASRGYSSDFRFADRSIECRVCGRAHAPVDVAVGDLFRFEGPSDPADEAIVIALECPHCGAKGVLVSAYGPDADAGLMELEEVLRQRSE
jgi:hypothetical protein